MADQDFILAPATVKVSFKLAPVENIHISLSLLHQTQSHSGFGPWVLNTYESMSAEQRHIGKLIWLVFNPVAEIEIKTNDYPSYIKALAAQDPIEAHERVMKGLMYKMGSHDAECASDLDVNDFPKTKAAFITMLQETLIPKYESKGMAIEVSEFEDVYDYLQDPQGLLELVVNYHQHMWDTHIEKEWQRNLPSLKDSLEAFSLMDYSGMTALEAARAVTGRDLSMFADILDHIEAITFTPNHHIGPYVTVWQQDKQAIITFGARIPKGAKTQSIALSQSELLVRLNALADDVRLSILELLTQHDELCAQDIMVALDLTQSSTSRHLRQLTATGYLVERRREVAKCYSLNVERVDDTLKALKQFLRRK